ncbi:MAG TPA: S8 family serine peptidase [Pyrinomonadaceae bacterium]|nr:S8 family serine peptidase [Pyrinomonadaceae bacterium]
MRANSLNLLKMNRANYRNLLLHAIRRKGGELSTIGNLSHLLVLLVIFLIALSCLLWLPNPASAVDRESIIVELAVLPPSVVAADQARKEGRAFDRATHDQAIRSGQNAFLAKLQTKGIDFTVTTTPLFLAGAKTELPNRFTYLINAVGLDVPASAVESIKAMPEVRHVTINEQVRPHLDNSVRYVRANDGSGNKTIFTQGGGPASRYDGTGQVIAVLDTGIEHTHPTFDTRFDDANFLSRTGDVRPVRLAGQPYVEGVNHPKVVYFFPLTATTNEDDVGHGTHGAADSAGLKVKGPGLDRVPGNADDQIVEGVAPGALLMNYKICETVFTCVGTVNIVTALEDAVSPTDPAGNPKPVATVINMSFGGGGSPNDASAVAASNAALAGAVPVASAGNSGPDENTVGSPSAGRRVISVAATNDPGAVTNELDVLVPDALRYTLAGMSTGAQNDTARPVAAQDQFMKAILMGGAPDVTFPLGQHYVYVGFADTPDQVPAEVNGRIALASRGSTVDGGAAGTGVFGHKAAEAAAKGAVALLIFNNVDGELEAATTQAAVIPVYGISKANGEYLRDALGFQSPTFNKDNPATWGTISDFPVRINPPDPSTFSPDTTGFSSRGPVDNFQYLKPDVTAPGQNIYAATIPLGGANALGGGGTMSDPSRYISVSGTSFSGPHVAGAAALVRHALLQAQGQTPIPALTLRSGAGAGTQQTQNGVVPQSIVRAALTNTATNLREADGETQVSNTDDRTFIHEIGSGLIHVIGAVDARAAMGTNDANGTAGPDNATDADFLPTHSFGENQVIGTGVAAQSKSITVTLQNISGLSAGATYSLSLVDGGALRGDVTRPITGTTGFSVSLGSGSAVLGGVQGNQATFNVNVTVDGTASGLQIAGTDDTGAQATEFLWWVVAAGSNGEVLRMPFYYRAVTEGATASDREAPFQNAIQDDTTNPPSPDQVNGVDQDGSYKLSWTFPGEPAEQPCNFQIEEATSFATVFADDGSEPLLAGSNSKWTGGPEWISSVHPNTGTAGYSVVYIDNLNTSLTMNNAVAIPAGIKAQLVFESFQDIEDGFDFGIVEASGNGGPFIPLAQYTGAFSGQRVVDLSGFAGQAVKIRFRFTSDQLISTPLFLGWFIDDIQIQTANFATIGTVGPSVFEFDVTNRPSGTYFYRIAGLFGDPCSEVGAYSNIRQITVDREGGAEPVTPTASFTAMPNPAEVNQTVNFDGSASTDNDTVGCDPGSNANKCIVSYFWSFGDGATQTTTGPTTTHSYNAPGTYRATLTVTDNDGQTASTERFIEVTDGGPKPGEQQVTGGGWIPISTDKGNFGFNVKKKALSAPSGHLNYDDRAGQTKIQGTSFDSFSITGNRATFSGPCTVNKAAGFTCTVDVIDNGESGSSDFFRIRVSNGYDRGATLGAGNIKIHK